MQSVRAVRQRVFVEQDGQLCYLDKVVLDELGQGDNLVLTGYLPRGLDLISPQTFCLIFQEVADPRTFFDTQHSGMMMVFNGFRVIGSVPVVAMKNQITGEVTIPIPEFECVCGAIHQWVVTDGNVRVTTMRQ